MTEIDKVVQQLSRMTSWLHAAKENDNIRAEMFSAAEKTCADVLERIKQLNQNA